MAGQLEGKVAIVTGGASGIGLATVKKFVAEGAKVIFADIQDDLGSAIESELGANAVYVHTDVTSESEIEALVAAAVARFGKLDVMFNNAGAQGDPSPMDSLSSDGFDKASALLVRSVFLGHKYAARQFIAQGTKGSIISTSSAAAIQGGWSAPGYTIAKHGVTGAVRQAAVEYGSHGIRCNAIAPGIIMTPIYPATFGVPMAQSDEFLGFLADALAPTQPIGRVGQPEDVADAAVFLASDASTFITGVVLPVDGGVTSPYQGSFVPELLKAVETFNASH